MNLKLTDVFDDYPNPFFIIRPIIQDHVCEDFVYIYTNHAFGAFLERPADSFVGRTFRDCFHMKGERVWLDLFDNVAHSREHVYVESNSPVIGKKVFLEAYQVSQDMCACVIHDYKDMSEGLHFEDNQELQRKAHCDYLTGFFNRFYLMERYEKEMERENIGVTVMDINNLKQVNDTYGHAAGDELILRVARMIRAMYRDSTVFRMGGDEFVIITPDMDRESFLAMSQCRRRVFEEDNLAAVGFRFFERVEQLKDCIDQGDGLMYEHKRCIKEQCGGMHWPVEKKSEIFDCDRDKVGNE